MSKGLGINKDLEPLVREVRRRGGTVEVTASTHVRWTMPDGQILTTGLTMSSASAKGAERKVRAALDPVVKKHRVEPTDKGKFQIIDDSTSKPVCNKNGFTRTFSTEAAAYAEARRLNQNGT